MCQSIYLSIQDSPREECSLEPQTICNFVTKMVPRYRVFRKSCAFSRIFFAILRPLARTSTGLPLVVQEYTALWSLARMSFSHAYRGCTELRKKMHNFSSSPVTSDRWLTPLAKHISQLIWNYNYIKVLQTRFWRKKSQEDQLETFSLNWKK